MSQFKAVRQKFPATLEKVSLFVQFKLSTDQMRSIYFMEDNLLYSVSQYKC